MELSVERGSFEIARVRLRLNVVRCLFLELLVGALRELDESTMKSGVAEKGEVRVSVGR